MIITSNYHFEAAHRLPMVPEQHKCFGLHGHNYKFRVEVEGKLNAAGWVFDFAFVDAIVKEVILDVVDHKYLNKINGLENPTAEIIALWIQENLEVTALGRCKITVWETDQYAAIAPV